MKMHSIHTLNAPASARVLRHGLRYCQMAVSALMIAALTWLATGCRNSELWDEVPAEIAEFINQYFPYSELNEVTHSGANYHIRIDDGPGLTFDSKYQWIAIDGYGMPMPQVLLFDQLPPALYDYLQEAELLNSVFSMERDATRYTLTLLSSTIQYDIDSGQLTGMPE